MGSFFFCYVCVGLSRLFLVGRNFQKGKYPFSGDYKLAQQLFGWEFLDGGQSISTLIGVSVSKGKTKSMRRNKRTASEGNDSTRFPHRIRFANGVEPSKVSTVPFHFQPTAPVLFCFFLFLFIWNGWNNNLQKFFVRCIVLRAWLRVGFDLFCFFSGVNRK